MELQLKRIAKRETYTIGKLSIDGQRYCDTCEDRVRDLPREPKVPGETAIPPGRYRVIVNYSSKFRRKLPRLLNVPYFEGILIHRGNTAKDSAGCILVGENRVVGKVLNSTQYEQDLTARLQAVQKKGEEIWIEVI